MIAVAHRLIELGEFVRVRDHVIGHGQNDAIQKAPASCPHSFAGGVEEQGIGEGDRHVVSRYERGIGIGEGDEIMLAKIHVQMVLVAEMLDPGDAAGRASTVGLANVRVLGACANRYRRFGHVDLGKHGRGTRLIGGLPKRAAT